FGPQNCSFWGPSQQNITDRIDSILQKLRNSPIPVSGVEPGTSTGLATYADLKQLMLSATYQPIQLFPGLADVFLALENGNGSLAVDGTDFVSNDEDTDDTHDVDTVVKCIDGYRRTTFTTLQDFENYVKILTNQSKYFGDAWPVNSDTVLCRSLELQNITTRSFSGEFSTLLRFSQSLDGGLMKVL
ncbi:hypothetical protein LTR43_012622, partial [Exophiala xenobiotica]